MSGIRLSTVDCRDWVHQARRGNPWIFRKPRHPVDVASIVSPLRFDVTIRASFLGFYREHRELFQRDFGAFIELARQHDYFVWFKRIACVLWQPNVLSDPHLFAEAWADRLQATARLHDSFEQRGFDSRFPITLYEGRRVYPTETGKRVSRTIFAGDGNHRLAMLMANGQQTLLPSQYRIKRFHRLVPGDTTPLLLRALEVDEDRYFAFLEAGYPALRIERHDGRIEVEGPAQEPTVAEVRELLRIDLLHLNSKQT